MEIQANVGIIRVQFQKHSSQNYSECKEIQIKLPKGTGRI